MANRRFPSPWSVEDIDAAFVVKDATAPEARLCVLGGRAWPPISGQDAHALDAPPAIDDPAETVAPRLQNPPILSLDRVSIASLR